MSFKIYTKTGDTGKTSLIGGRKVAKNDPRIEAYGTVDELNSFLGLLNAQINNHIIQEIVLQIQDRLFTIGSILASDPGKEIKMKLPQLHEDDVSLLEREIDRMTRLLPEMKSFILPGGNVAVSTAHVTRCVCRRAERACVSLFSEEQDTSGHIIKYLNRLSDFLFTLARYIGNEMQVPEIPWHAKV